MTTTLGRVCNLAERQHGAVAVWQMRAFGLSRGQIVAVSRRLRPVFRGVYAVTDLSLLGWYRAATLALGPDAVLSHLSALMLFGLRPLQPSRIHVSVPRGGERAIREGIIVHRRRQMEIGTCQGIPVTSPGQALRDANLAPFELFRAVEAAQVKHPGLTLPDNETVALHRAVSGTTRSDAEAQFLILCAQHGVTLPLVNHVLNGIITDFHWPEAKLILEVDGWEFHKDRGQFEEDRRRELVHAAAGWQVVRASGRQVFAEPALVLGALGV